MTTRRPFRFGVFASGFSGPVTREAWLTWAHQAEDLGYATFFVSDHFPNPAGPLVGLTAAAMVTTTLRVGSYVFANDFRHPAVLAKEAAMLDVLSGGRLELGLGAGWRRDHDYVSTGIPFDPAGVRIGRLAEAVRLIKALYTEPPVTFAGEHYTITDLALPPRPVQRPHPPLIIGGGGRRLLELAAREADIVGMAPRARTDGQGLRPEMATAAALDQQVAWVREAAGERFPALELSVVVTNTVVTDDRHQAAERLSRTGRLVAGTPPDELLDTPHVLVGSVEHMVDDLQRWRERYGLSYIVVFVESLEAFAPVVARLAGR